VAWKKPGGLRWNRAAILSPLASRLTQALSFADVARDRWEFVSSQLSCRGRPMPLNINASLTLPINVEICRGIGKFPPPVQARRISPYQRGFSALCAAPAADPGLLERFAAPPPANRGSGASRRPPGLAGGAG
jgi:hypothetical protein